MRLFSNHFRAGRRALMGAPSGRPRNAAERCNCEDTDCVCNFSWVPGSPFRFSVCAANPMRFRLFSYFLRVGRWGCMAAYLERLTEPPRNATDPPMNGKTNWGLHIKPGNLRIAGHPFRFPARSARLQRFRFILYKISALGVGR